MEKKPLIKHGWLRALIFMITLLVLALLLAFATGNLKRTTVKDSADILQGDSRLIYILAWMFVSFITVFFFRRVIDKRSFSSLGFTWTNNEAHAATGFFMGLLLLGIGSLILIANNNLHWTDLNLNANQLFLGFGLMLFIAVSEELVFRGYVLNNLLQSTNKWMALGGSALLFALFHANNPGINLISLINIFLAGLMLGVNYIYTRNLWFGILFHFSWNFYQGSILGYKVSGVNLKSLLEQELTGNSLFTGGNFGFEGSVIDSILSIAAFTLLAWVYEKKLQSTGSDRPKPLALENS